MSTLADITDSTNNVQRATLLGPSNRRLSMPSTFGAQDENSHFVDTDPVKPHFMTSTSASRAQVSTPQTQSRPTTPASLGSSASKSSGWMASAGKRFGITTPKSRKTGNSSGKVTKVKNISLKSKSRPPAPDKQTQFSPASVVKGVNRRSIPPRPGNPPDKPLPSLPIATVVTKSPVHRRSLIDATEKPLRRSISPTPGVKKLEEWPALIPSRSRSPSPTAVEKPAQPENNIQTPKEGLGINRVPSLSAVTQQMERLRLSSLILPQPSTLTSVNESAAHENQVRQTETPLMRARLSAEVVYPTEVEAELTLSSQQRLSKRGPIRAHPRSRRMVTSRGSPYSHSLRPQPKVVDIKKRSSLDDQLTDQEMLRTGSAGSSHVGSSSEVVTVKKSRSVNNPDRRSSIPIPRRLIRNLPEDDSESEVSIIKPQKKEKANATTPDPNDGDIDTKKDKGDRVEFSEVLDDTLTIQDTNHESVGLNEAPGAESSGLIISSDEDGDSDIGSLHCFGEFEPAGYRVKRLSSVAPRHGPVLRVSDAADTIIFGPPRKRGLAKISRNDSRRSSAPNLRRSLVIKEAFQKSKENVMAHLPRSMTNQSLTNGDAGDDAGSGETESEDAGAQRPNSTIEYWNMPPGNNVVGSPTEKPEDHECATSSMVLNMAIPSILPTTCPSLTSTSKAFNTAEGDWPLKDPKISPAELDTVHELPAEDDSPWISPLGKADPTEHAERNTKVTTREIPVPPDSPISHYSKSIARQPTFPDGNDIPLNDQWSPSFGDNRNKSNTNVLNPAFNSIHPPRSSSKLQVRTWNTRAHVNSAVTGRPVHQKTPIPNRFASPMLSPQTKSNMSEHRTRSAGDSVIRDLNNRLDALNTTNNHELALPNTKTATPASARSSKSVLSNFRGLFHKRSAESGALSDSRTVPGSHRRKTTNINRDGSPFPYVSSPVLGAAGEAAQSTKGINRITTTQKRSVDARYAGANFVNGQIETDAMQRATRLAFDILDLAKDENGTARKGMLVDIGKKMVHAVTASREAEKAMEEAKQAAARAEIAALTARQKVEEMVEIVQGAVDGSRWI